MWRRARILFFSAIALSLVVLPSGRAQSNLPPPANASKPWTGEKAVSRTTVEIKAEAARTPKKNTPRIHHLLHEEEREKSALNPQSKNLVTGLTLASAPSSFVSPSAPQSVGVNFTGSTYADEFAFPPDSMGAVGPSQFLVVVNSRIRSFNKNTGVADGILDVDSDVFFSSVTTTPGPGEASFTSDPRVRYDRLTGRWIIVMIDVTEKISTKNTSRPNRVMFAVSNGGTLTNATIWNYFYFQQDLVNPAGNFGGFADYPTLGIDVNASYIGTTDFDSSGFYLGSSAFVVRKSSILGAGPIVVSAFRNLTGSSGGSGPESPQGVDNFDSAATEGYVVGADNASYGTLVVRRISNPGGTPTISPNIFLSVAPTSSPRLVPHLGNTASGTSGYLDSIDERLMMGVMRNGHLWTAHAINVQTDGTATTSTSIRRAAVRWYEIQNLSGSPALVQSGTIFDPTGTNPLNYWMPSVMVSGQGHVAMGFSVAGPLSRIDAATAGRLASDLLGITGAPFRCTASTTAYNPSGDSGGTSGRRWGDYSFVSVDPEDDMTMWSVQEFCNATNSYGVRVAQLIAPPPAIPASCSPAIADHGAANFNVVLTGTSTSGSGFFDPGPGFAKHLSAVISGTGVTVNSAAYTDPTHLTLNLSVSSTAPLGSRSITVTNPDGQLASSSGGILTINPQANLLISQTASPNPVAAGYHLTYNLTATNNGPDAATNVVVTETLPASVSFLSSTPPPSSQSGVQLTFNLGTLASGASVPIRITVAVPSSTSGALLATASISSDLDDLNSKDNSADVTTAVLVDTDHDGIPDQWEIDNQLDPNDPTDAAADFDGDGFSNLQEYLTGTDPRKGGSFWAASVAPSGADAQINFRSIVGRSYRVEETDDLTTSTSWTILQNNISGTGSTITLTDANALGFPHRFYRVIALP